MGYWTEYYKDRALRYVQEYWGDKILCAGVGGSVGRGTSDEYSDIDVVIYVDNENSCDHFNAVYTGEILQVDITTLPAMATVEEHPWEHRFLLETEPIFDPTGILTRLKAAFTDYIHTPKGRQRIFQEQQQRVRTFKQWAYEALQGNQQYAATNAAMATCIDAAFSYAFMERGQLSTSSLLAFLDEQGFMEQLRDAWTLPEMITHEHCLKAVRILENYRANIRERTSETSGFMLSTLQDLLAGKKARRYMQEKKYEQLLWDLNGEAFWISLEASNGLSFDEYYAALPTALQTDLQQLGFLPADLQRVEKLCLLSDMLMQRAKSLVDTQQ